MEFEVDAQVLFDDTSDELRTVGGQHFAVGFHIDEVRDFDKLLLFRLTPVSYKVPLISGTVQLALGFVLHFHICKVLCEIRRDIHGTIRIDRFQRCKAPLLILIEKLLADLDFLVLKVDVAPS